MAQVLAGQFLAEVVVTEEIKASVVVMVMKPLRVVTIVVAPVTVVAGDKVVEKSKGAF
ncbi:hypothetical protein L8R85_21680 [Vibrio splendidus]|uniref:Uncharacterized protein n=1 Tax=Vibrio splendidus TaxID=29497 RepID=A0AA43K0D6_VIBSP|nr:MULTISPECIES: hypothetical protein [Vibrio]MDH5923643.1 hypothetical protein [Vibrio splendidus]